MIRSFKMLGALLCCVAVHTSSGAKEADLAVSNIPADLLKGANAVTRYQHMEVQIISGHEIYVTEKIAITILNEKGAGYGVLRVVHDQFEDIEYMEGKLYDQDGRMMEKMKKKEVIDVNGDAGTFAQDRHTNVFEFECTKYPYTCVYEYKVVKKQSVFLDPWMPKFGTDRSLEQSDVEVQYPLDFPLRYRAFHINNKPAVKPGDGRNVLSASISHLAATGKEEDYTVWEYFDTPEIIFAADKFEMQDRKGDMASWKGFGQFFYELNKDRDVLPDGMKKIVHSLADTCHTDAGKIRVLYNYLEHNYRYVLITFGIGGWQTFDAQFVAEKGYGDCKALSNYMKAMLKEAGITSYAALAYGSRGEYPEMMLDFPYNAFNHVILCVPQAADTTWLECTSNTLPAGYLSTHTSNRYVLMLTPDGGVPVKTPGCKNEDNIVSQKADITINDRNEMTGTVDMKYAGEQWDRESGYVVNAPKTFVDNYFNSKLALANYVISNYEIDNQSTAHVPFLNEHASIKADGNITVTGKSLFVPPTVFSAYITAPSSYDKRTKPFAIHRSYTVSDTIVYHLDGEYTIEGGAQEESTSFAFGNYHCTAALEQGNLLRVVIGYELKEGTYPAANFSEYIKLYKLINANVSSNKIVLVRK